MYTGSVTAVMESQITQNRNKSINEYRTDSSMPSVNSIFLLDVLFLPTKMLGTFKTVHSPTVGELFIQKKF